MASIYSLSGRRAIITGANRGLGLEIAHHYAAAGAELALGARDFDLLETEIAKLKSRYAGLSVIGRRLDVSVPEDVADFARWASEALGSIDVLVNNAGVYGPMGDVETVSWDAWAQAFAINVYGSVLMASAVVPGMKQMGRGTIIQISGGGATNPLPGISAYASSKAAIVRFAETLALEVKDHGITVNAIAPGALNTRMLEEVLAAGPERVGQAFYDRSLEQQAKGGTPPSKGAEAAVFLASDAARGITGRLISAVWDRYEAWPDHLDALDMSDLYTLRRITGRDRNQDWGDR
ncbi:SDR family NAD(P)-dependent oxidoreductase [Bosea sp. NBC_00550]|uniref:SDR family NAD(P)-dependent oxidoreductase n=1 Tax=Bosea sp. NBC_00550 TaxID=2969621 RepID=UPI00222FF1D1|nr:SDR family oxidoreductase [Bosea sp. NBC_00550]UZF91292.1 SDR family oxidoreductase [Bosea sp. NBC_00550]